MKHKVPELSRKTRRQTMKYLIPIIGSLCVLSHLPTVEGIEGFPSILYEELQQLNASCSPIDTCVPFPEKKNDTLKYRHCECDSHCKQYKTCCLDSPYAGIYEEPEENGSDSSECFVIPGTGKSYFMVTKCPRGWSRRSRITNLCEAALDLRDPFILAPATYNGLTYKNFFCALCHGAVPREVRLWYVAVMKNVSRPVSQIYKRALLNELVFNKRSGSWGRIEVANGRRRFIRVFIDFVPSRRGEVAVRPCISQVISDCDPEWKDEAIRDKCLSYMAAICVWSKPKDPGDVKRILRYRNVHCATCNFVSYETPKLCELGPWDTVRRTRFSFTMLLDINPRDGNTVGKVSRCEEGEAYDIFFKKCRTLVCALPGFVMKGDRCVKA